MDDEEDKKKLKPKTIPPYLNIIIGSVSGMVGISFVHPADLLKIRMQLLGKDAKNMTTIKVAKEIYTKEGPLRFFDGVTAALFRQATYGTARLGCFDALFDFYKSKYGAPPNYATKVGMGATAGGVGAFIGTPADVALVRMTSDGRLPPEKRRNYKHVFDAFIRIIREEGVLTLWRGAVATITRAMVVNAVQLSTYTQAREILLPQFSEGIWLHICSSIISGFVTTTASLPVDIVKTRVQTSGGKMGQLAVFTNVIKTEGFFALWIGFIPALLKVGPQTVLTFTILEQINKAYLQYIA